MRSQPSQVWNMSAPSMMYTMMITMQRVTGMTTCKGMQNPSYRIGSFGSLQSAMVRGEGTPYSTDFFLEIYNTLGDSVWVENYLM